MKDENQKKETENSMSSYRTRQYLRIELQKERALLTKMLKESKK